MSKNTMPGVDSAAERLTFGQNVRRARERQGRSQRDVHVATGIAQSHLSEIESGQGNISMDTMVKLATALEKPLWNLLRPPRGS
jgi:transcriptional regulator with XRE-family HTH domain